MRYHRQNPLREYIFKYICKYIQVIARTRLHTNKENSILQRMQPTYPHAAQKDPAMQCSHIRNHDHPIYIQLKTLQCWGFRRQNTITILSKKANYEDFCWLQQKSNTVSAGSPNWWTQPPKREKTHCFDMLRSDMLHNSLALTDKFSTHFASRLGFDMLDKSWSWTGNFSGNNCCTTAGTS